MPDWSYQTVFRPLLFLLPPRTGRSLSLRTIGKLGELPLGGHVIDFMGHMRPPVESGGQIDGIAYRSPIGLGYEIDPYLQALQAFSHFGFGFIEVGPVSLRPATAPERLSRHPEDQSWSTTQNGAAVGVEEIAKKLEQNALRDVKIVVRLESEPGTSPERAAEECGWMMERLASVVHVTMIVPDVLHWSDQEISTFLTRVVQLRGSLAKPTPLWLAMAPDLERAVLIRLAQMALDCGIETVRVEGWIRVANNDRLVGRPARQAVLDATHHLRTHFGEKIRIVSSGGVHEPIDALRLRDCGANLIVIDSGLIFSGPGLPKRINDVLSYQPPTPDSNSALAPLPSSSIFQESWVWMALMGLGMFTGSLIALGIASTRVLLPYDEAFVGMTREHLVKINPRLLSFMAHDRVTLAGTMIAIGVLYLGISLFGIRHGLHWAWKTVVISASVGFASFFLFLGFAYFDPFHAFVTTVLLQFLVMGLHSNLGKAIEVVPPGLRNDRAWHWSLWGQLLFIIQAVAFIFAGILISSIGVTTVFVPEDLHFMETTATKLISSNPRLLPLIAHDRATFGGMLVSSGLAFLTATLWGFRAGRQWLWWTFLLAGLPGYAAAITVHLVVGYHDPWHLAPAFGGLFLFSLGLFLSYPFLVGNNRQLDQDWQSYRTGGLRS